MVYFSEETAADDKRGKLYKPKSKIPEAKTFLPLETPPQFLAFDKRNVSFTWLLLFSAFSHHTGKEVILFLTSLKALKKSEKEKKKSNLELFKEELKQ